MDRATYFWVSVIFVFQLSSMIDCEDQDVFNVMEYGAVGDSNTDDSKAFLKAWAEACGAQLPGTPVVEVPFAKTFLLKPPMRFEGPCKSSNIHFQVRGDIIAPSSPSEWKDADPNSWIFFKNVNGLIVNGTGHIDGKGSEWWNKLTNPRPRALSFTSCNNMVLSGLTHLNSATIHINIHECVNVTVSNLQIYAPENSPNTDGIDISGSKNVQIYDCTIGTGDDCIAITGGSSYINVTSVACGPGHGISIGSLGKNGETDTVEEIHVKNCSFKGTQNGARIKTWQGGSGYARKITFEDIQLIGANNPIFIDQYYCPNQKNCDYETKAVQISDVSFVRFNGTSASENAITLKCSKNIGCSNIFVDRIDIGPALRRKTTQSSCINAHGKSGENVNPPVKCLLN